MSLQTNQCCCGATITCCPDPVPNTLTATSQSGCSCLDGLVATLTYLPGDTPSADRLGCSTATGFTTLGGWAGQFQTTASGPDCSGSPVIDICLIPCAMLIGVSLCTSPAPSFLLNLDNSFREEDVDCSTSVCSPLFLEFPSFGNGFVVQYCGTDLTSDFKVTVTQ